MPSLLTFFFSFLFILFSMPSDLLDVGKVLGKSAAQLPFLNSSLQIPAWWKGTHTTHTTCNTLPTLWSLSSLSYLSKFFLLKFLFWSMSFEGQCTLTIFYNIHFSWAKFDQRFNNYTCNQHACWVVLNIVIKWISNYLSSENWDFNDINVRRINYSQSQCISPYAQSCIVVKIFNAKIFFPLYFSMNFPFNHW